VVKNKISGNAGTAAADVRTTGEQVVLELAVHVPVNGMGQTKGVIWGKVLVNNQNVRVRSGEQTNQPVSVVSSPGSRRTNEPVNGNARGKPGNANRT